MVEEKFVVPKGYRPLLNGIEVECAIRNVKGFFAANLAKALNLVRVAAPLFVRKGTGINDDLNGIERPASFKIAADGDAEVEIVQSLAKWKRLALARYEFKAGLGLYTDMIAVRPDEVLDNLHSIYVDQWDWEKIIEPGQRNIEALKDTVRAIYDVIRRTEFFVASRYPAIQPVLPERITFVTAEDAAWYFPDLKPSQREDRLCAECGAVFIIGIGAGLHDGYPHDVRAPDYDDWTTVRPDGGRGLNGDLLLRNPILECAFEVSSMGIRVDAATLRRQLRICGVEERAMLPFHCLLLDGVLPQTIGGGIGQSRLCMFLLRMAHIGEVAVSVWPRAMAEACTAAGINLLGVG